MSTDELLLPTVSDLDGTEVFRAIQSSGAVVQVPYSAITAESNPPVSGLTALTGAGTADGDLHQIYDLSVTSNKKQTVSELAIAVSSRLTNTTVTGTLHATGAATLDSTLAAGATTITGALSTTTTLAAGTTVTAGTGVIATTGGVTATAGGLTVTAGTVSLPLTDYADDAAAAVGLVPVGGLYRTASAVKIRVA
jgi:hypothetical protein